MHLALVVEDDATLQKQLRMMLEGGGFRVALTGSAARGRRAARARRPDIILVDLGLSDLEGIELIRSIRARCPAPIFVLSARTAESPRLAAFEAGADDYVSKPFSAPELLARMHAALRQRAGAQTPTSVLQLGELTIDLARRVARRRAGPEVRLTPLEHRIIESLHRHQGRVVSHDRLMQEVWGPGRVEMRSLRVLITALRRKLEPDPARPVHLLTAPGLGYRLIVGSARDTRTARAGAGHDAQ